MRFSISFVIGTKLSPARIQYAPLIDKYYFRLTCIELRCPTHVPQRY